MKIAIVGGIGSGKSEVLKSLKDMGVATLDADAINAELLAMPEYVARIEKLFPSVVEKGQVNRKKLSRIVFNDSLARARLNAVAHPLVLQRIKRDERNPLVVEIPLLFESGAASLFDAIVFVLAPLEKRIERLTKSRNMSIEDALSRINSQVDEEEYARVATKVIVNDSSLEQLKHKTEEVFSELLQK